MPTGLKFVVVAALVAFAPQRSAAAQAPVVATAAEHVQIEHLGATSAAWQGQAFRTTLRVLVDDRWLREHALQPFGRELGVPLQVQAPWTTGMDGVELVVDARAPVGPTFALGESVERFDRVAPRLVDGREWTAYERDFAWRARRPGAFAFEAPLVRVAWSPAWRDDAFQGRQPLDRRDELLRGGALSVRIDEPPEDGRPIEWTGAVGRWSVLARLDRDEAEQGAEVVLELVVLGEGAAEAPHPGSVRELRGLRVLGFSSRAIEGGASHAWQLACDRAGRASVVPPRVAWFDPESGRYEASSVEPLEIVVRAAQPQASDTTPSRNAGEGELEGWIKATIAVAIVGLGIAAWIVARRRAR
ncbi:MAG: hypothetical protein RIR65_2275 [Planctomycetota bacterium]